jgi:hypothetical protein
LKILDRIKEKIVIKPVVAEIDKTNGHRPLELQPKGRPASPWRKGEKNPPIAIPKRVGL